MLDYIYHPITIMYLLKYKIQAVLYVYVYHFLIYNTYSVHILIILVVDLLHRQETE